MLRSALTIVGAVTIVAVTSSAGTVSAQEPVRSFFDTLDANNNGQVDLEEWENSPPIKQMAEARGFKFDRVLSRDEFQQLRDDFMRFGGDPNPETGESSGTEEPAPELITPPAPQVSPAGSRAVRANPRSRPPLLLALPDEYKARDTNHDGQIALYEWPRSDFATFKKLDLNNDGFITPSELAKPAVPVTAVNLALALPESSGSGSQEGSSRDRRGRDGRDRGERGDRGDRGRGGYGRGFSGGGSDPQSRAESAFRMMDRNQDGSINPEEWRNSRTMRPLMEKAGVDVSKSTPKADFIQQFLKINQQ